MTGFNPNPLPATTTVDYMSLAAQQVGELRAQLDRIVAEIEAADDYRMVPARIAYITPPTNNVQAGPNGGDQPWVQVPEGDWKTAIVLYPPREFYNAKGPLLGSTTNTNPMDLIWTDDTGFTGIMQGNSLVVPLFNPKSFKLYAFGSQNATFSLKTSIVNVVFSRRMYYNAFPAYAGF